MSKRSPFELELEEDDRTNDPNLNLRKKSRLGTIILSKEQKDSTKTYI